MCNRTFQIQRKEAATRWPFEEYGTDDITKLELALWKFAEEQNRHWSIFINEEELPFEYEPDLTTIFNEIPEVLELLLQENKEPAILDFFEQGTSIVLSMKRKNDTIWVEFQKTSPLTGKRFDHLPEEPQPVLVRDFFEAWFQFLDDILKTLTRQEHNLETELSYMYYSNRINKIKEKFNYHFTEVW